MWYALLQCNYSNTEDATCVYKKQCKAKPSENTNREIHWVTGREMKKQRRVSPLYFSVGQLWNIAQALLCRCMLNLGGLANWATPIFWLGIKTKCLPHFGPVCLCCVPGPLTRCQSDTWCQRASSSNRCSAGDSCSLADWSLGTWWGVAVWAHAQSLQLPA